MYHKFCNFTKWFVLLGLRYTNPNKRRYIANILSISRIPLGLMVWIYIEDISLALTLFSIGLLTDFFDGPIARASGKTTKLGAVIDPICDKFFIVLTALAVLPQIWPLTAISLGLLEAIFLISALYGSRRANEEKLKSNIYGKLKMTFECFGLIAFIGQYNFYGNILFLFALAFAIASGFKKLQQLLRDRRDK